MQPFKYDLPSSGPTLAPRRKAPGRAFVLGALAMLAGLAWYSTPRVIAMGALGWPLGNLRPAQQDASAASAALLQGEHLLRAGKAAQAIRQFDEALRLQPDLLAAYQRGLDARAVAGLPAAPLPSLLPDASARVTFLLARAADEEARRPAAAMADFDTALATSPADPRALRERVALLAKGTDLGAAIEACEQALRAVPGDITLVTDLVSLRRRTGNLEGASAEVRARLLPLAASSQDPQLHLALILDGIEQGLGPDALHARHLALAPQVHEAQRRLLIARAYLAHYRANPNWHRDAFDHALVAARSVLEPGLDVTDEQKSAALEVELEALATRAARETERADLDQARRTLDQAIALRGALRGHGGRFAARFADLYMQRAHLEQAPDRANKALEAAIALVPDHPARQELARIYANVGVSFLGAKKAAQAVKPLERAVSLAPDDLGVLARYHAALVAANDASPLQACMHASGQTDRALAAAAIIEGYAGLHQSANARKLYEAVASGLRGPGRELAHAEALAARGDLAGARALYLHAPASASRWRRLGDLDRAQARASRGARRLALLRQAQADQLEALAWSGAARDRSAALGLLHEAVTAADAASDARSMERFARAGLRLDPLNPALGLALSNALARVGQTTEAIEAAREALDGLAGPGDTLHAPLRERLGSLYRAQKRYAEAIVEFRRGLEPASHASPALVADLTYGLALAHAGNGDREEALNAIRQYVAASAHDARQSVRVAEVQTLELDLTARGER